jgi:5-methyltetrahydropteroyltriglutamate--homocysteine methyltransferase
MVEAHLTGAYPRSERLVEATRAAVRGRISEADVDKAVVGDIIGLVDLQSDTHLDSLVDGQLNWQDLFRPFSELFSGIQLGSLTRWFDNNTFYRQPIVADRVAFKGGNIGRYFRNDLLPPRADTKAILPGPFTLAVMSQNASYSSMEDLVDEIARGLKDTVAALQKEEYRCFQFNEPALCVGNRSERELEMGKHGIETCAKGVGGKTILQTYFGDASPIIDTLLDYDVDSVGVDFYATSTTSLTDHDFNKELGCGCVDGRNSLLESPEDLRRFVADVEEQLAPKGLSITPNCDLDFLPQTVAEKKVHLLEETKKLLE